MNVLQPLMNEKEIQTDDENIHNQLVNLINSMLFNQRWLNKNRKVQVNTLRNLLKNCCYISMFNRLLLTMIERPRTLLLQSFTLLSSSSSALSSSSSSSSSSISNDLFIIGAGQMRTGTTSLKFALQLLYNQSCYHMYDIIYHYQESHIQKWINLFNMNKKFINIEKIHWNDIFNECRFAVDYPTCVFYKELMKIYPNAKVILTVRDADSWVSSCRATTASDMVMTKHTTFTENIIYRLRGLKSLPILHDNMYTKAFGPNYDQMTDDELRDAFIKWNQEIIDYVPKDRLLIFDPKDGWTPLCEFLNIPIPENVPFPHLNKRVDLRNRLLKYRFLAQFLNFSLMISFLWFVHYIITS
uniref:Nad dependent epimerase/dehydratase n=2 Tax=Schistosoma mansoni TaxID=6183 RepID=A0A3Q0KK89_SCHMA